MTRKITLASLLLTLGLCATANAQYLTSTKAGFVNKAEGKVYILRADSEDGEKGRASLGTQMHEGDRLSTSAYSFAETLLNPGSYLRLNENTEIRSVSVDFNSVRFELIKGTVIAEIGEIGKDTPIEIVTPHGALTIAKTGLHRIAVKESASIVSVRQGEIHLGNRDDLSAKKSHRITRGKVVTLKGSAKPGPSDIAKLDKDAVDKFDSWSFGRAQALTAANVRALRRSLTTFAAGWYYDPFFGCYTYMPFRSSFWSPYGFGFFNNYRHCGSWYNPYYGGGGYYGGGSSGGVVTSLPPRVVAGHDRGAVTRGTDGRSIATGVDSRSGGFGDFGSSRGGSSSPSISAPSSSSSTVSAPASRGDSGGGGGGRSLPGRP
jgi:hypothetical protein